MSGSCEFSPQLSIDEAFKLAGAHNASKEAPAMAAGIAIMDGDFSRQNLTVIFDWKTQKRGKSRLRRNSDQEIADVLAMASRAQTPRAAIGVLLALYGVDTPVASAVMTALRPTEFTIIDFRALEALGNFSKCRSLPFYLSYLDFCRGLALEWRMPLRKLDHALWGWSEKRSKAAREK